MSRGARGAVAAGLAVVLLLAACSSDDDGVAASTTTSTAAVPASRPVGEPIALDGRPAAVTLSVGSLFVADDDSTAPDPGHVQLLDPDTGAVHGVVDVGASPVALVPVPDGAWSLGATGLITKIDLVSPGAPLTTTVDLQGALVDGVVAGGKLWVGDIGRSEVFVLDPATGKALADPVVMSDGVVRLVVAGDRIWVSGTEDRLTPIDVATGATGDPVTVGTGPIGMALIGDALWVANSDDDTVSRLDAATGSSLGPRVLVGHAPIAIVPDGDGGAWVLNQDDPSVSQLDEHGAPVDDPIRLPLRPRGMARTPTGLWIVGVSPSSAVRVG